VDYLASNLEECLQDIRDKKILQCKASEKYNIPWSTIKNKLKGQHSKTVGRQPVFNEAEEECFVEHMMKLTDYGFPIDTLDFRMFIKAYLDRLHRFKDNVPGLDFICGFLSRHKSLSVRLSTNVKKARMKVNEETLSKYIDNLKVELEGISPAQIWNYDETNMTDDPGQKCVICRRGMKYVDRYCNHSKTATSVMFCGNTDGTKFLPRMMYISQTACGTLGKLANQEELTTIRLRVVGSIPAVLKIECLLIKNRSGTYLPALNFRMRIYMCFIFVTGFNFISSQQ